MVSERVERITKRTVDAAKPEEARFAPAVFRFADFSLSQ